MLPSIAQRDRPSTATTTTNLTQPQSDTSPFKSTDSMSVTTHPRFLNPLKFAKGERKGNSDTKTTSNSSSSDGQQHQQQQQGDEMDLWYMTQPGENRYWMYLQDGLQLKLLQKQLNQTFHPKHKRPHTPVEPPAAAFPQPTSQAVRARLNLLKWLSSPSCLLFYECDEVVSVDDGQLDAVLGLCSSGGVEGMTDGGARVITVLMKWSKQGKRYSGWDDVQADMAKHMAAEAEAAARPSTAAVEADKAAASAAAMKKGVDDENRRKEALQRRMERERQERFAALRQRQEEERSIRQQRKADKDALRNLRTTAAAKWRDNAHGNSSGSGRLAALRHGRGESTASTLSTVSMAESVKAGGGRRRGAAREAGQKLAVGGVQDTKKEPEEQAEAEEFVKQIAGGEDKAADEAYDQADDDEEYAEDGADEADTPDKDAEKRPSDSLQSSGGSSDRSVHADKEAQEEKQPSPGMPTIDRLPSDDESCYDNQRAVSAVSSTRPSSRVPPLLTPSPRRGGEVAAERASARGKKGLRAESSSGESISARAMPA